MYTCFAIFCSFLKEQRKKKLIGPVLSVAAELGLSGLSAGESEEGHPANYSCFLPLSIAYLKSYCVNKSIASDSSSKPSTWDFYTLLKLHYHSILI